MIFGALLVFGRVAQVVTCLPAGRERPRWHNRGGFGFESRAVEKLKTIRACSSGG